MPFSPICFSIRCVDPRPGMELNTTQEIDAKKKAIRRLESTKGSNLPSACVLHSSI
jgi:hypothetical protein